jgi:choline dehydrogenase-like flavoprotein
MYHWASLGAQTDEMPAVAVGWNAGGMGIHWTAATPWPWGPEVFDFGDPQQWQQDLSVAQQVLHVHPSPFAESPANRAVTSTLGSIFDSVSAPGRHLQPMPMAVEPDAASGRTDRIGPSRIFEPIGADDDPNFALLTDTLALRVLHENGHATGVLVRDMNTGAERELFARQVIICADALRSPQLLFASGIRPPALGRYLNEHAFLTGRVLADLPRFGLDVADVERPREGEWISQSRWIPHSGQNQPYHGQVMDTVYFDDSGAPLAYGVSVTLYIATDINSQNRLTFDETSTDATGMPRATIHFSYSNEDLNRIEQARIVQQRASEALGPFDPTTESALLPPGSSLHFTGTVRMSDTDDGTGVCDPNGRVWGFDNLLLAGNGVVPTALACNSTLTGMITAVRAARAISSELAHLTAR